jgi:predicted 3-demethylubiquinone-9 3-methyltransferase (glyoxalase superfamily)
MVDRNSNSMKRSRSRYQWRPKPRPIASPTHSLPVPEAEQCGWVKDRFGVSWQIVPRQLIRLIGDANRDRARRTFDAMMQMKRIDIAALERAANGVAPSA